MSSDYNKGLGFGADFTIALGGLVSGIAQANALRFQGDYEQKIADMNSRFIEMEAKEVIEAGKEEAKEHGKKINQMVGTQRARFAGGNIKVDSGTAKAIQLQTLEIGFEEKRTIKNNAYRKAFGLKTEAFNVREQGLARKQQARNQAGSTLVTSSLGFAADLLQADRRRQKSQNTLYDPADVGRGNTADRSSNLAGMIERTA